MCHLVEGETVNPFVGLAVESAMEDICGNWII